MICELPSSRANQSARGTRAGDRKALLLVQWEQRNFLTIFFSKLQQLSICVANGLVKARAEPSTLQFAKLRS